MLPYSLLPYPILWVKFLSSLFSIMRRSILLNSAVFQKNLSSDNNLLFLSYHHFYILSYSLGTQFYIVRILF